MEENSVEAYKKVSYDGRLQYYEVLKKHMSVLAEICTAGDHKTWVRVLAAMASLVKSFMKKEEAEQIQSMINECYDAVLSFPNNSRIRGFSILEKKLDQKLQQTQDKLYYFIKPMLVPVGEEEDDEFDIEKFMREQKVGT